MQTRAEITQAFAAGAQQERRDRALFGEDHAVKAVVGFGEFRKERARGEVECSAVDQYAPYGRAVAAQEFGGGVVDKVGAVIERTQQIGRGEGGIHQQRYTVRVRNFSDGRYVENIETGVSQ